MAKNLISMCLLQLLLLLFLAKKTVAELSQNILNGLAIESTILRPEMKLFNHTPCEVASKQAMNSASIVDVAINVYLALFQEIAPLANMKIYSEVDFRESIHPAKSESE